MSKLGKLEEVTNLSLRNIWPNEAKDFTPWLSREENIQLLADAIGVDITVDETESSVGDFNVDIYATETGTGKRIIIENQLEDTNHDHLGKIITYASGKSAQIIIWIVKHAREEHRSAIVWLNNHTDETIGFFLCEVKLYRIDNSNPAVLFKVIESPNDWVKEINEDKIEGVNGQKCFEYWEAFQNYAFNNNEFAKNFKRGKSSRKHWQNYSIGFSSCHISLSRVVSRSEIVAELYVQDDKNLFNYLLNNKNSIENETNLNFEWKELPERKASRIILTKKVDFDDMSKWNEQFDWMIDVTLKVKKSFKQYLY